MKQIICIVSVVAFAAIGADATAQQQPETSDQTVVIPSPIMVVDFERIFVETLYGRRIADEVNAERERVQAENDRIAAELLAEESALTEARSTMDAEAFRLAASAFDERAQNVRASREAEQTRLVALRDDERAQFIERIQPLISAMMLQRGAVVTMDRRAVIQAIGGANATDAAIAMINERLGDGELNPNERPTLRPEPAEQPDTFIENIAPPVDLPAPE